MKRLLIVLLLSTSPLGIASAHAKPMFTYQDYALSKVQDYREFKCLLILWTKESHWNPKADNPHSSAFGIPQLLNLKETNPYKQIDRGLKYIVHRYNGMCDALNHHKRKGYY